MCSCKSPQVRISEQTGRVFCATCREYLDTRPQSAPGPLRAPAKPETSIAPLHRPVTGDGDPRFPGGIGCEYDDSLWATADSWARHMREDHGIDPEQTNDEFDQK